MSVRGFTRDVNGMKHLSIGEEINLFRILASEDMKSLYDMVDVTYQEKYFPYQDAA